MSTGKPTPYSELAEVIAHLPMLMKETRRARGLSMRAAAVEIGVSFSTVHRFEHGKDSATSVLVAVLRWMDTAARAGDA